jgi:hypothetical protein
VRPKGSGEPGQPLLCRPYPVRRAGKHAALPQRAAKRASSVRLGRPVSLPTIVSERIARERNVGRSLDVIADDREVPTLTS